MPQPSGLRRAAAEAPKLPPSLSFFVIGGLQLTDAITNILQLIQQRLRSALP